MRFFIILFLILIPCYSSAQGIDTTEIIQIGGIKQFVSIKGKNRNAPILLFLHGGPGKSVMALADGFTNLLREEFVVVQWDQRQSGETFKLNTYPQPLSISLLENDTEELIIYLLRRFSQEKLFLFGHSFGTVLGFHIADKHPDQLYAYIAMSPMTDQVRSIKQTMHMLKNDAKEKGNGEELEELAKVRVPFKMEEQLYYYSKWLFLYNGVDIPDEVVFKKQYLAWAHMWLSVCNKAIKKNLFKSLKKVRCPVYFFVGRGDDITFANISDEYYKTLSAPVKKLFWFEKSGHTVFNTEPEKIQRVLIDSILTATKL